MSEGFKCLLFQSVLHHSWQQTISREMDDFICLLCCSLWLGLDIYFMTEISATCRLVINVITYDPLDFLEHEEKAWRGS